LLSSATTSVLLNGTTGKEFMQKECQAGDPLSPLLFALGADILQIAINHEYEHGTFHLPIP
jgi:hypothetical protein